jgi:large conductance mechanosensitive channel
VGVRAVVFPSSLEGKDQMLKGFRDFIMRGNLVELAVAFVMAAAFGALVTSFVKIIMDLVGKMGGTPNFSAWTPGGIHVGEFITALVVFLILAVVIYAFVVKPYEMAKARFVPEKDEAPNPDVVLLTEIRDLLRSRSREI